MPNLLAHGKTVRTIQNMDPVHKIAADLLPLATPLADLKPLPGNPRRGDINAVARSYDHFGQRKPVVAQPDGTIIAGNHQYAAAIQLGWTHLAVTRVDDDDATAKAFALADNRTADLGTYDDADLLAMIETVAAADAALVLDTGYTADDIADLARLLTPPDLPEGDNTTDGNDEDTDTDFWPTVIFQAPGHLVGLWNEAVKTAGGKPEVAFAGLLGADVVGPDLAGLL